MNVNLHQLQSQIPTVNELETRHYTKSSTQNSIQTIQKKAKKRPCSIKKRKKNCFPLKTHQIK